MHEDLLGFRGNSVDSALKLSGLQPYIREQINGWAFDQYGTQCRLA